MITCFSIWNHFNLRAKFPRFFGYNDADAVNRGFIVGGGFGFDQGFEQGFGVHGIPQHSSVQCR
jgi:hypothetical protein